MILPYDDYVRHGNEGIGYGKKLRSLSSVRYCVDDLYIAFMYCLKYLVQVRETPLISFRQ